MFDKLTSWVAILAMVVGLGSIGATKIITDSQAHKDHTALCHVVDDQNAKTRGFIAQLVADPSVSSTARAQVTALALKQFPLQTCTR